MISLTITTTTIFILLPFSPLHSGVDPTIMGYGPVPAIRGLLKSSGLTMEQVSHNSAASFLSPPCSCIHN